MNRTRCPFLTLIGFTALLLGLSTSAARADTTITKNRSTATVDGKGGVVKIMGNQNTLTIKNASKVEVMGNKNVVKLDVGCPVLDVAGNQNTVNAGPVKTISVMGNQNKVTYQLGPMGEKPSISNLGNGNTVQAGR